jgi:hypothetical protein
MTNCPSVPRDAEGCLAILAVLDVPRDAYGGLAILAVSRDAWLSCPVMTVIICR